jgi:hypothetical protein
MMMRAYSDKRFEDPQVIKDWALGRKRVNANAATLVLEVVIK